MNEPYEAYVFAPQHGPSGEILSAAVAFRALADGYDALKSVDPGITVAGLGLSPAANDKTSTSPVRFIGALGYAYRASGRSTPIMDELDDHIYPDDAARQGEEAHYAWPQIGPGDFDRLKQASGTRSTAPASPSSRSPAPRGRS